MREVVPSSVSTSADVDLVALRGDASDFRVTQEKDLSNFSEVLHGFPSSWTASSSAVPFAEHSLCVKMSRALTHSTLGLGMRILACIMVQTPAPLAS